MIKDRNHSLYPLLILLAGLFWGCISIAARPLNELGFTPVQNVMVRSFVTALLMGIVLLIKDKTMFIVPLKLIPLLFLAGIFGFLGFNFFYMSSINENSVSVACMLMYTSPIYVTVISVFLFKEKITLTKIIALIGTLGGATILLSEGGFSITKAGLIFGIGSGIGYALYSIFAKIFSSKIKSETFIFYVFSFSFLGSLPFADLGGFFPNVSANPVSVGYFILIAAFFTFLPYLFYTIGINNMQVGKANIIAIFEVVVSSLVGAVFYKEKLGFVGILGIIIVIASLILLELNPKFLKFKIKKFHLFKRQ